jgi:polyhydroxybutyrate depolymerase
MYLVGHSNGAFMAHRFACDHAGRIAAIVTLAGMQWKDAGRCPASSPVSVLHVHGRDDQTIHYEGGSTPKAAYPGAVETVRAWAAKDGCAGSLTATGQRLDLDASVPGEETAVERYPGCTGVDVELWTINGGSHTPPFNDHWAEAIWDFLAGHPKAG